MITIEMDEKLRQAFMRSLRWLSELFSAIAVVISPYVKPGTVSNTYYNHYSLLRTLEDIFQVKSSSPGIDDQGHLGFAAQKGLAPFGPDVFTN